MRERGPGGLLDGTWAVDTGRISSGAARVRVWDGFSQVDVVSEAWPWRWGAPGLRVQERFGDRQPAAQRGPAFRAVIPSGDPFSDHQMALPRAGSQTWFPASCAQRSSQVSADPSVRVPRCLKCWRKGPSSQEHRANVPASRLPLVPITGAG